MISYGADADSLFSGHERVQQTPVGTMVTLRSLDHMLISEWYFLQLIPVQCNIGGIPVEYQWNICSIPVEYQWYTSGISVVYQWNISCIPVEYQWYTSGIPVEICSKIWWYYKWFPVVYQWNIMQWYTSGNQLFTFGGITTVIH